MLEVAGNAQLARRVGLESQGEVGGRHAAAVVGDAHEPHAALLEVDLHARRARVQGVLAHLLDASLELGPPGLRAGSLQRDLDQLSDADVGRLLVADGVRYVSLQPA